MIFFLPNLATAGAENVAALVLAGVLVALLLLGTLVALRAGVLRITALAISAIILQFGAAWALIQLGYVFSRICFLGVLVVIAAGICGVASSFRPGGRGKRDGSDWLGPVAALLAIPLAILGAAQFVLPGVADTPSGGSNCLDVPVQGSRLIVRTGPSGNYLRTGPGSGFSPVERLDAACLVGADKALQQEQSGKKRKKED